MTNNAFYRATNEPELNVETVHSALSHLKLAQFIEAYRSQGYRSANLDPLHTIALPEVPELTPAFHHLSDADVDRTRATIGFSATTLTQLERQLKATYCHAIGLDCSSVRDQTRRQWLFEQIEQGSATTSDATTQQAAPLQPLLQRLVQAEEWERYVQDTYPKAKRFSLEGCESLLPLMDALVDASSTHGVKKLFFAMPHRGRLNLLVNLMELAPWDILRHFDSSQDSMAPRYDLPFHLGCKVVKKAVAGDVELELAHNPSHLESVYPVLLGMTRAYQDAQCPGEPFPASVVLHGDAAFCGQGVVMESLKLTQHSGYSVHGTIHVIINNQIGFTTANPVNVAANSYCTDIARIIDAPVIHVNADQPEAVLRAARLAFAYRLKFGVDVVIDLIGYRRWGHAEQDTATVTQPQLHALIDRHPSITALLGQHDPDQIALWREQARQAFSQRDDDALHAAHAARKTEHDDKTLTALSQDKMSWFVEKMTTLPPHFDAHPNIAALIRKWRDTVAHESRNADWCFAENMAYASLLDAGINLRISGMDVERGTFMHRHAAWHSQQDGIHTAQKFIPLKQVAASQSRVSLVNSPLSEEAVLGFEYGFSVKAGAQNLVIWEAQFGDFVNGAQIMVDQYISSGADKWGHDCALTLLLPHGYEGVGPEHSSAYLSRFLLLCAQDNMRIVYPSESAQWFHLLRQQATLSPRKPLVVMAPKGQLYQKPASHSPLDKFVDGKFEPVLADPHQPAPEQVERVVLCSGKFFYDLEAQRQASTEPSAATVAILRLEQLYPFPQQELQQALAAMCNLKEIVWAQEEDKNQGAWLFVREHLETLLPTQSTLRHVCRQASASGAHASIANHAAEQLSLVKAALGPV